MSEFIDFAAQRGLIIQNIERGAWRRVPTISHPRSKNGAYYFDSDYGFVQDWASMDKPDVWQDKKPRTPFEHACLSRRIEASKAQQAKDRLFRNKEAANKAKEIMRSCVLDNHAYMGAHGLGDVLVNVLRVGDEMPILIVPMFFKNELCGVQKINIDGDKRFLFGQICNGAEFVIGSNGLDVWCEGFCTGMAAHKALSALKIHARVHIAFSANNLLRMAKKGFVIADNDSSKTGEQVAIKTGLKFYMPPEIGTDFCDFWKQSGTLKAGMALKKAMM